MGMGGQRHAPAILPPGKIRYPSYRRLGGPQGRSGRVQKNSPPPGFDPRRVQPVVSRYTDWAIVAPFNFAHNIAKQMVGFRNWTNTTFKTAAFWAGWKYPEDGSSRILRNVRTYTMLMCHIPENRTLHSHRCGNWKSTHNKLQSTTTSHCPTGLWRRCQTSELLDVSGVPPPRVLKFITPLFGGRNGPSFQDCFFEYNCHCMMIIYIVIKPDYRNNFTPVLVWPHYDYLPCSNTRFRRSKPENWDHSYPRNVVC